MLVLKHLVRYSALIVLGVLGTRTQNALTNLDRPFVSNGFKVPASNSQTQPFVCQDLIIPPISDNQQFFR